VKKKIIIGVIISVILIGLIWAMSTGKMFSTLTGGSVLSVSSVDLLQSDTTLGSKVYLINLVANGGGESLKGTITPETIQEYGITEIPSGDFSIDVILQNYTCNYNLNNDGKTIYKTYYESVGSGCLAKDPPYSGVTLTSLIGACKSGSFTDPNGVAPNDLIVGSYPSGGNCDKMVHLNKLAYWVPEETNTVSTTVNQWGGVTGQSQTRGWNECSEDGGLEGDWVATEVGGVPFYQGYRIDTATQFDYTAKVIVTNNKGEQLVGYITPTSTSTNINNVVNVKFVGNVLSNTFCPVPAVENVAVKDTATGKVKFVNKLDYDAYVSELDNFLKVDVDHYVFTYRSSTTVIRQDPAVGGDTTFKTMSDLNNKLNNMYRTNNNLENCVVDSSQTKIKCSVSTIPTYPELQLRVRADWVGVYVPVGKPEILGISKPSTIVENTFIYTEVQLRNNGAADSFDLMYKCDVGSEQIPVRASVAKESTEMVRVPLFASYGAQNCVLTAVSVNDKTVKTNRTISLTVDQSLVTKDIIQGQSQTKEQLLSEISQLYLQYQRADESQKIMIEEQMQQLRRKMEAMYTEQAVSLANVQEDIETEIAKLQAEAKTADAARQAEIQRTIIGLQGQQKQLEVLQANDQALNEAMKAEIMKIKQEKDYQIGLLTIQMEAEKSKFWIIIIVFGIALTGIIGYLLLKRK